MERALTRDLERPKAQATALAVKKILCAAEEAEKYWEKRNAPLILGLGSRKRCKNGISIIGNIGS